MSKKQTEAQVRAKSVANDVFGNLNGLHLDAVKWEEEHYKPAVAGLYGLLGKALTEFRKLRDAEDSKSVVRAFTDVLKSKQITCTKGTSLQLKVVRVVFGIADTHGRANRYAKVLELAYQANVTEESFVEWINDAGGIDQLQRTASKSRDDTNYVELASNYYENFEVAEGMLLEGVEFEHEGVKFEADNNQPLNYRLLVVRKNEDGSFAGICSVPSAKIVKSALTCIGKLVQEDLVAEATKQVLDKRLEAQVASAKNPPKSRAKSQCKDKQVELAEAV